jgi:hypothetical protein
MTGFLIVITIPVRPHIPFPAGGMAQKSSHLHDVEPGRDHNPNNPPGKKTGCGTGAPCGKPL